MSAPSYRFKLERARGHFQEFDRRVRLHLIDAPPLFTITKDVDFDIGGFRFRIGQPIPLPVDWSLIIGDCLNNARGALDHLAWDLVSRGTTPSPDSPQKVAWPIGNTKDQFQSALGECLPGVNLSPLTSVVRKHQPYIDGDRREFHELAVLRRWNNMDKHQQLHVIGTYPTDGAEFELSLVEADQFTFEQIEVGSGFYTLKDGPQADAELAVARGTFEGPNPTVKLMVHAEAAFFIERQALPDVIERILGRVESIISDVEAVLASHESSKGGG